MTALLTFPFFYVHAVIAGALRVAREVVRPVPRLRPILLRVPLELSSPRQRLLLANLITMTPGTLSVDEEDHGGTLLVHPLHGAESPESLVREIKGRYETVVAKLPI